MEDTIYIGTYTHNMDTGESNGSKGIYHYALDRDSGRLSLRSVAEGKMNPGFLTLGNGMLYSANEHKNTGHVSSYRINPHTGELSFQNDLEFPGAQETCYVALDRSNKILFAANYGSGNFASCRIGNDGTLTGEYHLYQHTGSSVHPRRQRGPHVHSVNPDFSGNRLIVADLGIDQLRSYQIDHETAALSPDPVQSVTTIAAGEGPRHMAFHPNGKYAYLSTEMGGHVIVFDYDHNTGKMIQKQAISTLPSDHSGDIHVGHIAISADGQYVLVSNRRGHHSTAVYKVNPVDGTLSLTQITSCGGEFPRHFSFNSDHTLVIIANQGTQNVSVFRFHPDRGVIGDLLWQEPLTMPMYIAVGNSEI